MSKYRPLNNLTQLGDIRLKFKNTILNNEYNIIIEIISVLLSNKCFKVAYRHI